MRCFSILVLGGASCSACLYVSLSQHAWFTWMGRYQTSADLRDEQITLVRCEREGKYLNKQSRGPRKPGLKNHCPNGTSKVLWVHSLWLLIILGLDYTSHDASQRVDVWTHDYAVVITSTHYSWTAPCLIFELASCMVVSLNGQERLELGYSDPQLKLNVGHGFEIGGLLLFFLLSYLLHSGALARTMPITGISL